MLMPPPCYVRGCKHYLGISQPDGTEATEIYVCEAFPDGIPKSIIMGKNAHERPLPKQKNKIVFEQG